MKAFNPFKSLIRFFKKTPYAPVAKAVEKGNETFDKEAERARAARDAMEKKIRRGAAPLLLVCFLCSGCETARTLRAEGYTVSRWEAAKLNYYDAIIWIDDKKDVVTEFEIGGGE